MAHYQQLQFVKTVRDTIASDFENFAVLEIGSYDVNGSIRKYFSNSRYIGVDLVNGPGVDIVCSGSAMDHPDSSYDIVLSCECFEHNPLWAETFKNMVRMTKERGLVVVTCATTGRAEHGTARTLSKDSPGSQAVGWDYYKNLSESDFESSLDLDAYFSDYFFLTNKRSYDLYFCGLKRGLYNNSIQDLEKVQAACIKDQAVLDKLLEKRGKREKYIPKPLRKYFRAYFEKKYLNDL